ncbi:hypothetical protein AAFF_G00144560 [Aldrovandia affinis]|uniref:OTU domain-containing protein 3 n=1 Tax=Aldrovandia affinis TaxID=143900 RepID=A0AAD7T0K1_9TELE|nr:hypothetical protein AAFF_G00144560 [Aldrovandia affinis]
MSLSLSATPRRSYFHYMHYKCVKFGKLIQGNKKGDAESKQDEKAARRAVANDRRNRPQGEEFGRKFSSFNNQLQALGLKLREVPGDGNCLFRALGDQLEGHSRGHLQLRQEIVQYMQAHRQDFEPFVEDDMPFTEYLANLSQPGTFAGNDAIVAFARSHQLRVIIHQLNTPLWEINGSEKPVSRELHVAYRYGDHYDSVRPVGDNSESPSQLRIENLNWSKGQCESWQPGGRRRCRQNDSPPIHSDDDDPILRRLVLQNPSGQGEGSQRLRAAKPHCFLESDGYELPIVSYASLWEESGTGRRLFGPATPTDYSRGKPSEGCTLRRTTVVSKQRKEQQRLKIPQRRTPQDQNQNQSESLTLVPALNKLSI